MLDCLIVGAGPAGLTAAIYLARFHLKVGIIDAGKSRALLIPETHNHAGYPDGISGAALLDRIRQQAVQYGAEIWNGYVSKIERGNDHFIVTYDDSAMSARTVLLATGVVNRRPDIDDDLHDEALAKGLLRYCPICDGFEVSDQNVAVIGTGEHGLNEAEFLRSYTKDISLISPDWAHNLDTGQYEKAQKLGINLCDGPAKILGIINSEIVVTTAKGEHAFKSVYPALGSDVNNQLANAIGVKCNAEDGIVVDAHQRTSVSGVYAAGDVVIGLDQISHAMGEGGVAAVAIRNDLAERSPLLR